MARQTQTLQTRQATALGDIVDVRPVLLGLSWLSAGIMVYVLARPPGVAFLPQSLSLYAFFPAQLASLTGPLPIFFHVGAMSYLTIGLLGLGRRGTFVACASWATFDALFELGQQPQVSAWLDRHIPAWFDQTPLFEFTRGFFVRGTFDVLDLIAAVVAAVCVCLLTQHNSPTRTSL